MTIFLSIAIIVLLAITFGLAGSINPRRKKIFVNVALFFGIIAIGFIFWIVMAFFLSGSYIDD